MLWGSASRRLPRDGLYNHRLYNRKLGPAYPVAAGAPGLF